MIYFFLITEVILCVLESQNGNGMTRLTCVDAISPRLVGRVGGDATACRRQPARTNWSVARWHIHFIFLVACSVLQSRRCRYLSSVCTKKIKLQMLNKYKRVASSQPHLLSGIHLMNL